MWLYLRRTNGEHSSVNDVFIEELQEFFEELPADRGTLVIDGMRNSEFIKSICSSFAGVIGVNMELLKDLPLLAELKKIH